MIIDVETTTIEKGNPFVSSNQLLLVGLYVPGEIPRVYDIEYSNSPYKQCLEEIQLAIDNHQLIVGFNLKFDLHWLRRYGIVLRDYHRVWDCQLAYFIDKNQSVTYPSMEGVLKDYELGEKDKTLQFYLSQSVNPKSIPFNDFKQYLRSDLENTEKIFNHQSSNFATNSKKTLLSLCNYDLLAIAEMEWNGFKYNAQRSLQLAEESKVKKEETYARIQQIINLPEINLNSPYHISSLLYGGSFSVRVRVTYPFKYKDGRIVQKEKWGEKKFELVGHFKPPKRGLSKEGYYPTDEASLRKLLVRAKGEAKELLELLLEFSFLDKKIGTYYEGIPELMKKMEWNDGIIHGSINQCSVITGRTSSSRPNLQNFDSEQKPLFTTRFLMRKKA